MSSHSLPPPLVVWADEPVATPAGYSIAAVRAPRGDRRRAEVFGKVLARARASRGEPGGRVEIFAAADPLTRPPAEPARTWVPHVFCWQTYDQVALAWEPVSDAVLASLPATPADVTRWAESPELLLRLARLAAEGVRPASRSPVREHLSFRWLIAHQELAAQVLTEQTAEVEHVSLHVDPDTEEAVARVLTRAIGLVEIPRPATISTPGIWLQAGASRVHLNSRSVRPGEPGFPGTAPNHICFSVADLESVELALHAEGVATKRAGSLGQQVWLRLPGGTVIELQPARP